MVDDFKESRSVEMAPALLDLEMEAMLDFASASEYIPTEYTLKGTFEKRVSELLDTG